MAASKNPVAGEVRNNAGQAKTRLPSHAIEAEDLGARMEQLDRRLHNLDVAQQAFSAWTQEQLEEILAALRALKGRRC